MKKTIGLIILWIFTIIGFSQIPGSIDLSFGSFGKTLIDWNGETNVAEQIHATSDGGIIICGSNIVSEGNSCLLAKVSAEGEPDLDFGDQGIVEFGFGGESSIAFDFNILADGRILVAGLYSEAENTSIGLAKFLANGDPDPLFGYGGTLIVDIGDYEYATSVLNLSNNKFVIAGTLRNSGEDVDLLAMRFLSNGSTDVSFGTNGYVTVDLNNNSDDLAKGMVLHDYKILVSSYAFGNSYDAVALVKFENNGSLDTGFGVGGTSIVDGLNIMDMVISPGTQLAIDNQNRIVVSGQFSGIIDTDGMLLRFLSTGYPDNTFGDYGLKVYPIDGNNFFSSVAVQADGKIIAGGKHYDGSDQNTFIIRALDDGSFDPSFGFGLGYSNFELSNGSSMWDGANAMMIQNLDKVVMAGFADTQNDYYDLMVTRVHMGSVTAVNEIESGTGWNAIFDSNENSLLIISGYFSLNETYYISLFNLMGQLQESWKYMPSSPNESKFSMEIKNSLSEGIYLVNIVGKDIHSTRKVVYAK